jgi:heme-degrading monooxygenase HmoA
MCAQVSSAFTCEELAFLAEQRRAEMFVTMSTYKAKAGEEDAIIALHEDWQRNQQPCAKGYLSGELLRNVHDHNEFVAIMRFENRESAQALASDAEQVAWYRRLVSLVEHVPLLTEYASEWRGD